MHMNTKNCLDMKQNKNIREMLSRMSGAGLLVMFFVLAVSCKEDRIGQTPTDGTSPSSITDVRIEATPGGAVITYKLPNESDISYVYCEYKSKGETHSERSSVYSNKVEIMGLPDMSPRDFTLYLVDHSENRSVAYTGSFTPLEPPYQTIFKSLTAQADFGGITAFWENETKALIGAYMLVRGDHGEWENYDLAFSTLATDKRSIRGYNTDERDFGLVLKDRWENYSDTFVYRTKPIYEEELNKKKFTDAAFNGDNNTTYNSRPVTHVWNGINSNATEGLWHSIPGDARGVPPQTFTIDMGVEADLSRMMLFNRTDFSYNQHNPRLFKVWGMLNPPANRNDTYWDPRSGNPWREDMILLGDFEVVKPSGSPRGTQTAEDTAAEAAGFEFIFESGVGKIRYLRFEITETFGNTAALHIQEITIYGNDGIDE